MRNVVRSKNGSSVRPLRKDETKSWAARHRTRQAKLYLMCVYTHLVGPLFPYIILLYQNNEPVVIYYASFVSQQANYKGIPLKTNEIIFHSHYAIVRLLKYYEFGHVWHGEFV